jgi:putative ABC transport system substrate-binding protein
MDRRAFLSAVTLGLLAAPLAARAQPAPAVRIGWLAPDAKPFALDALREALKELGWVEGGNLAVEQRYARGVGERYAELAADLVRLKVDVLVTDGSPATRAVQRATATIPIVFVVGNPVAQGFVASLSRPGGNLTGVAIITGDLNPGSAQGRRPGRRIRSRRPGAGGRRPAAAVCVLCHPDSEDHQPRGKESPPGHVSAAPIGVQRVPDRA